MLALLVLTLSIPAGAPNAERVNVGTRAMPDMAACAQAGEAWVRAAGNEPGRSYICAAIRPEAAASLESRP